MAAQQVLENASGEELAVILQEVPSWLENRGHPTDFVSKIVARSQPAVTEQAEKLTKAKQASVIGRTTASTIRNGIRKGQPPRHLMALGDVAKYDPAA